jgi:hypothetical protein
VDTDLLVILVVEDDELLQDMVLENSIRTSP